MREQDLTFVHRMSRCIHADFPEDLEVFAEKFSLYPEGCRVLWCQGARKGYLFSHPWVAGFPPRLNAFLERMPMDASLYYLHDLAVMPDARGLGAGQTGIAVAMGLARAAGMREMALVAVGESRKFWMKMHFQAIENSEKSDTLSGYGKNAAYMVRPVFEEPPVAESGA